MRLTKQIGLLAIPFLVLVSDARAGVYNFAEPKDKLGIDFLNYRATVIVLRDVANVAQFRRTDPTRPVPGRITFENPVLQRHLLVSALSAPNRWDRLTVDQKLNLSAYLLRCRREAEVRDLLEPEIRKHSQNFLLLANLATAYFYLDELERAVFYQQAALESWPIRYDELKPEQKQFLDRGGWSQLDHEFYRPVEEYFLTLLQNRESEKRRGDRDYQAVDPLFKDKAGMPLRFVNASGAYEPGKLSSAELAKLPKNGMEIVQQLLLWLPDDNRLFWQYGELLAAKGEIKSAKDVFFVDLEKLVHAKEFREHRSVLGRTPIPEDPVPTEEGDEKDKSDGRPTVRGKRTMTVDEMEKELDRRMAERMPYPFRDMVITFLVGIGVGIFAVWQYRELRRRHQKKPA